MDKATGRPRRSSLASRGRNDDETETAGEVFRA